MLKIFVIFHNAELLSVKRDILTFVCSRNTEHLNMKHNINSVFPC